MSKLKIGKDDHTRKRILTNQDTQYQLREFLSTIKNHQASKHPRVISHSLNLSPSFIASLHSPQNVDNGSCSLPQISNKKKKGFSTKINQFQQHIISNYLNAHLKISSNCSTIQQKSKTKHKKKKKMIKINEMKGSDNTTIQEAQFQNLPEDKGEENQSIVSRKEYSLREQPMKHYVKQRLQRKKRQWKQKSPLQLVTYFYQLGPLLQKESCNPAPKNLKNNKIAQHVKIELPSPQAFPIFIKTFRPSFKGIRMIDLIRKQNFTVVHEQGFLFFGQVQNNKRHGLGVLIKDSYSFEGHWSGDLKYKGIQKNSVGSYEGFFKNDRKQGKGQFRWTNGQIYSGQWVDGKKHGVGMWISPQGDSYMGQWKKGIVQGQGVHKCKTGQKYQGSFKNFLKHGWGKQYFPNGDYYEGDYLEGLPHGKGHYHWQGGVTYQGDFVKGLRQGKGTLKNPKGFCFTGPFVEQFADGHCQINYGNGDFYNGELKRGKRNGKGTLRQSLKRKIFDGVWKDDEFDVAEQ